MDALGYVPSHAARTMKSNRSGLIGLITGAISNADDISTASGLPDLLIVQGAQRVIEKSNKTLLISDTGGRLDRVPDLIRTFQEHRVEGILYVADYHKTLDMTLPGRGIPKVLVNCYDEEGTPAVVPDDEGGQYALTKAVIKQGHRRIAYLTLASGQVATVQRLAGFKRAIAEAGIEFDKNLVRATDLFGTPGERQLIWDALEKFFEGDNPPTCICCGNDRLAMAVYSILRSRGISVPEEVSVVGYDDHRLISETLYPTLTTAELPYSAMGARAAQVLLDLLGDQAQTPPEMTRVSGPVKHRGSLVAPRSEETSQIIHLKGRNET